MTLSSSELALFFETLGMLLSTGVTAGEGLRLMLSDAAEEWDKLPLKELQNKLAEVYELNIAMEKTGYFPAYAVCMIGVGARSGTLEETCSALADYYDKLSIQQAQIKSIMVSPFMLICIMAVVVAFLVNALMPISSGIYEQMGINIEADAMIRAALLIGNIAMWTIFAILLLP